MKIKKLNEGYFNGYCQTTDTSNPLVYSISIEGPYKNRDDESYRILHLTLVCGWDYIDSSNPAIPGEGWIDSDFFIDDVQSWMFTVDEDETINSVLRDEGYEVIDRKPYPIYHYDEEKDKYVILREKLNIKEDYQSADSEWGEPYTYKQVYDDLKELTKNFTEQSGVLKCYYESEKISGVTILRKHYKDVEVSDGRHDDGNTIIWIITYDNPKKENKKNEAWAKSTNNIPADIKKKANKICAKYSKWLEPKELAPMWDELNDLGISVLI